MPVLSPLSLPFRCCLAVLLVLVAGCGGDGGPSSAPAPIVPETPEDPLTVTSPSGQVRVTLSLQDGVPHYRVWRQEDLILSEGQLGLVTDQADLSSGLTWQQAPAAARTLVDAYELTGARQSRVRTVSRQKAFRLQHPDHDTVLEIQVRAWDQGVAFRYRVEGQGPQVVRQDLTTVAVRVPEDGGQQIVQRQTPKGPKSQEMYLDRDVLAFPPLGTTAPGESGWAFPLLIGNRDGAGQEQWILYSETLGSARWPHAHLQAQVPITEQGSGRWARFRLQMPRDEDRGPGAGAPRQTDAWLSPWRWLQFASTLPELYAGTTETDLAEPSRVPDTRWIRPGTATFDYIKETETTTLPRLRQYMAVARELGWSYVLVDSQWELMVDDNGFPMILLGERYLLGRLVEEAAEHGLGLFVWYDQSRLATRLAREQTFGMLRELGVAGVKVDKWDSDKQDSILRREAVLESTARHQLMVSLHNVTVPRGWHRTWPHLLGYEGGVSSQVYRGTGASADQVPALHATQGLLRGMFGSFDFGGILFAEPQPERNPRRTTPAHELALTIIYQAGLRTMSDDQEGYSGLPEAVRALLASVPAGWDESRLLSAEPGRELVVARRHSTGRHSNDWYIGGINGETRWISPVTDTRHPGYAPPLGQPRTTRVDLTALGCPHPASLTLHEDLEPAGRDGHALQQRALTGSLVSVTMQPFGGFVLVARGCEE